MVAAQTRTAGGAYAFETRPKAVTPSAARTKKGGPPPAPAFDDFEGLTLMSDPRVVRGSTYSLYRELPEDGKEIKKKPRRKKKKEPSVFDQALAAPSALRENP